MKYDFDLFVIGGGSGGVRAARMSAQMGARVAIAEQDRFGGTCVIRGCIPKKLLVYASAFAEEFEDAAGFGWTVGESVFDWPTLIANKDTEIARLEKIYHKVLADAGVEIFPVRASLKDAHTIYLTNEGSLANESKTVTAETILIATGGRPSRDTGVPGAECCITSDQAFHLEKFPEDIVIAGGGYIALEFAHIFHGLGAKVSVIHRGPKILRGFDTDLSDSLQASMENKGIRLILNQTFASCEVWGNKVRAVTRSGEILLADQVMLAIGRHPNTKGLGLEQVGVKLSPHGHIEVDAYSRSSVANIYAVGDITGRKELTPIAIHEAMCFAKTLYGGTPASPDHELVATAVFTRPEIGTVGLSEQEAVEAGHDIEIYKSSFRPLKHTLSGRDERAMMKLVVDAKTGTVLGCHIFGPDAGEMVQLAAVSMKMGATKAQFDATVAVHPTMAEELVTMHAKPVLRAAVKTQRY